MRKGKVIAKEISDLIIENSKNQDLLQLFEKKMSKVFHEVCVVEISELQKMRNVKTDNGILSIFKEQRQKYATICKIVNMVRPELLSVEDFDECIKSIHPSISEWYNINVVLKQFIS